MNVNLDAMPPVRDSAVSLRPEPATGAAAATQFEAFLLEQLMRPLTQSPFGPSLFDGGKGGRLAKELFVSQLARTAAERGSLGMSKLLERSLGKTEGGSGEPTSTGVRR